MIVRKTQAEIELMNRANEIVHAVHHEMEAMLAPGVSTLDLDRRGSLELDELPAPKRS